MFTLFLEEYPLRLFTDGLELLQVIKQPVAQPATNSDLAEPGMPGLIFLDVDMPALSGLAVLERLKQELVWQDVPVLTMSNRLESSFRQKAGQLGAVAYAAKPISIEVMRQTLGGLCQQWLN